MSPQTLLKGPDTRNTSEGEHTHTLSHTTLISHTHTHTSSCFSKALKVLLSLEGIKDLKGVCTHTSQLLYFPFVCVRVCVCVRTWVCVCVCVCTWVCGFPPSVEGAHHEGSEQHEQLHLPASHHPTHPPGSSSVLYTHTHTREVSATVSATGWQTGLTDRPTQIRNTIR